MKKILVVLGLLIIFSILIFVWWQNGLQPTNTLDKTPKIFVVKNGEGVREIANNLKTNGLIKDPIVFFLLTKTEGIDKKIQAGDFRLNPSMSAQEIATNLTHGTLDIWTTIPEGLRATEIADILKLVRERMGFRSGVAIDKPYEAAFRRNYQVGIDVPAQIGSQCFKSLSHPTVNHHAAVIGQ